MSILVGAALSLTDALIVARLPNGRPRFVHLFKLLANAALPSHRLSGLRTTDLGLMRCNCQMRPSGLCNVFHQARTPTKQCLPHYSALHALKTPCAVDFARL